MPSPDVFPIEKFREACDRVLSKYGSQALQYGPTEGFHSLRDLVVRHTSRYGFNVTTDNVLITSGSHKGVSYQGYSPRPNPSE